MEHELKIIPRWYRDVESGDKNFEIRKNDRDFKVGDVLALKEWSETGYTGRELIREIIYVYQGNGSYGLSEDYCILGIREIYPLEKQIPAKVDIKASCWRCPICGVEAHGTRYCSNCGQALDWRDLNDT